MNALSLPALIGALMSGVSYISRFSPGSGRGYGGHGGTPRVLGAFGQFRGSRRARQNLRAAYLRMQIYHKR